MPTWLVTGGAGYIGSHVIQSLIQVGITPRVIDNLSTGHRNRVPTGVAFMEADMRDAGALSDALEGVDGVIHLAGRKSVTESVEKPLAYWDANLGGTLDLLRAMTYCRVSRIIFSSTAAVYAPEANPRSEMDPLEPGSPYGSSKMAAETVILEHARVYGSQPIILRYFNVAGAVAPHLSDDSADNLIPKCIRAIRTGQAPVIYGDDYATRDGTAIRDYVHVADVADAHARAALLSDTAPHSVYNVGTGTGTTVQEIVSGLLRISRSPLSPLLLGRRPGDPVQTVADITRIRQDLGWTPKRNLQESLESAWAYSR